MSRRRRRDGRGTVTCAVALVGAGLIACAPGPSQPARAGAGHAWQFVLRGAPLVLSETAGGRRIEIVEASLTFAGLDAPVGRAVGRVTTRTVVRTTDAGGAPVTDAREGVADFRRAGDTVEVRFANGAADTYLMEGGGAQLRTIARRVSPSAPTGTLSILHVFVYDRADVPGV